MKRGIVLVFVLLFSVSFVFAVNDWESTNVGKDSDDEFDDEFDEESDDDTTSSVPAASDIGASSDSRGGSTYADGEYTLDFYIALGVVGLGILIALLFIYLFLRSPKNRWKKKPVQNVKIIKK